MSKLLSAARAATTSIRARACRLAAAVTSESAIVTVAYIGGCAAIAAGAGMACLPAGPIVGGLLSAGTAAVYATTRGQGGDE